MEGFKKYLSQRSYSSKTIIGMIFHVLRYHKWLAQNNYDVLEIDYRKSLEYIGWERARGISQETLDHYFCHVKSYYNYLIQMGKINTNPLNNIHLKKKLRTSSFLHLQALLSMDDLAEIYFYYQKNERLNKRDKILLGLLINQGMAVSELAHIKIKDVDVEKGILQVPSSKMYASRTLNIASHQILSLSKFIANKSPNSSLIFYDSSSQGNNSRKHLCDQIRRELKKNGSKVVFENLSQIRRSVLVQWVKQYNLRQAQYLAGHRWVYSTERYQVAKIEELIEEVNKYHPL